MLTPIPVEQFTRDDGVAALVGRAHALRDAKPFSDVIDADGLHYVDVVLHAKGVLGVALTGYTYALEEAGLRFRGVGGVSAGAIPALLLAATGPPAAPRSLRVLGHLAQMPWKKFVHGASDRARRGGQAWAQRVMREAWQWLVGEETDESGDHLRRWLTGILVGEGIETTAELQRRMANEPDGLLNRHGRDLPAGTFPGRLAIIAADLSTGTRFVFPRMAPLIFDDPETLDPSHYARLAAAIPARFAPVRVPRLDDSQVRRRAWVEVLGHPLPGRIHDHVFVDAGAIDDLPFAEFLARDPIPSMPTFGAMIDCRSTAEPESDGSSNGHLPESVVHHVPPLVALIDSGEVSRLDLELTPESQVGLFRRGVAAAVEILERFDWEAHKAERGRLARVQDGHAQSGRSRPTNRSRRRH